MAAAGAAPQSRGRPRSVGRGEARRLGSTTPASRRWTRSVARQCAARKGACVCQRVRSAAPARRRDRDAVFGSAKTEHRAAHAEHRAAHCGSGARDSDQRGPSQIGGAERVRAAAPMGRPTPDNHPLHADSTAAPVSQQQPGLAASLLPDAESTPVAPPSGTDSRRRSDILTPRRARDGP